MADIKSIGQQRAKSQHCHIQSYSDLILYNSLNHISKIHTDTQRHTDTDTLTNTHTHRDTHYK